MENDKNLEFEAAAGPKEGEFPTENSSRARNRTVMLTPEITGQVRARLAQEIGSSQPTAAPVDSGFESVSTRPFAGGTSVSSANQSNVQESPRSGEASGYASAPASRASSPASAPRERGIVWTKESPVIGFLVSFDANPNGDIFILRSGRLMITSDPQAGDNCLIINDPSVSSMHAIMRVSAGGEIQILDQLSEFGTKIKRFGATEEEELSGEKSTLEHGDLVKFGSRGFHVCVIALGS